MLRGLPDQYPQSMLEREQAGVPSRGAPAAAAQQWGECSVLAQASGLELCGAGPQVAASGLGAGASLDGALASALLSALANGSATACVPRHASVHLWRCAVWRGCALVQQTRAALLAQPAT